MTLLCILNEPKLYSLYTVYNDDRVNLEYPICRTVVRDVKNNKKANTFILSNYGQFPSSVMQSKRGIYLCTSYKKESKKTPF